jgi:hypothetical protein
MYIRFSATTCVTLFTTLALVLSIAGQLVLLITVSKQASDRRLGWKQRLGASVAVVMLMVLIGLLGWGLLIKYRDDLYNQV